MNIHVEYFVIHKRVYVEQLFNHTLVIYVICYFITGMIGRRGGVMMPRGGIPMMGVDRGGYPFAGPPLDYFFNPYLDEGMEFFGGGRPPFHHGLGKFTTVTEWYSLTMHILKHCGSFSNCSKWRTTTERHCSSYMYMYKYRLK